MTRRRLLAGLHRAAAKIGGWILGKLLRLGSLGLRAWVDGQIDKWVDRAREHRRGAASARTERSRRRHQLRERWYLWRAKIWRAVRRWIADHGADVIRELEDAAERSVMERRLAGVPRTPDAWARWLAANGGRL